ncbi:DNA polymerase-3 subunit gamma/tau [Ferrithrix thermotolerans DSM 19514]|uniref:DNA polymerase III subunit gamma/tau n=1 Tax=Ferrithrix thermotolerans DSM 19514 TaxID=1121881 RepID=A0A1M4UZP6_9ACTN|nr:DNA polymerase III subunit gamma/tau [Ferrithrix thermotolerans]SHE62139.1 DNA polymerase-3 subunit gamma/tau [Ferrithrix thermotolerans DSM 19514]
MTSLDEYQSLYRKYRPQRFAEVLGQDHITKALRNAVATQKVAHAYLFSGPRGTGKTSTARILAKALNCSSPLDGEPCDECQSCVLIREGRSYDVEELDAASNSGVDAIRSLIGTVATASYGNWKVYIIDEVHMLSTAASNALLKTLEEPPFHVVFVLATTSANKVLQTIRSRTQHFEFHLLETDNTERLLNEIASKGELAATPEMLEWARKKGRGSARDTLSYLDQALALGGVPRDNEEEELVELSKRICVADSQAAVLGVERLSQGGMEPIEIAQGVVSLFREAFLDRLGALGGSKLLAELDGEPPPMSLITKVMEHLGRTMLTMKDGIDPLAVLEVAVLSVADPSLASVGDGSNAQRSNDPDLKRTLTDLANKVADLEREVASLRGLVSGAVSASKDPSNARSVERDVRVQIESSKTERPSSVTTDTSWAGPKVPSRSDSIAGVKKGLTGASKRDPEIEGGGRSVEIVAAAGSSSKDGVDKTEPNSDEASKSPNFPSKDRLVFDWGNSINDKLPARLKTRFQTARFADVIDGKVRVLFPNDMYLKRALEVKAEIQTVIADFYGLKTLELSMAIDQSGSKGVDDEDLESVPEDSEMYEEFRSAREAEITDPAVANVLKVFPNSHLETRSEQE